MLLAITPVAGLGRVGTAVPAWRTRSGMTSRLRWRTQMITDLVVGVGIIGAVTRAQPG